MRESFAVKLAICGTLLLHGCCGLIPCHPGTGIVGTAQQSDGSPMAGAKISLYGVSSISDAEGCFHFDIADGLPFRLSAVAPGMKSVEDEAIPGKYSVTITFQKEASARQSFSVWKEISENEFRQVPSCK